MSDKPHSHGSSRPSLDTEAVSADEGGGDNNEGGYEEIQVDLGMLDPSCLVPPTIPNTLGADDIDKVIAALTNVPDVKIPDGLLGGDVKAERNSASHERSGGDYAYEGEGDFDRKRKYYDNYDEEERGRFRGRGRGRGRGGGYRGGRGGWNEGGYRGGRGGFKGEWIDRTGQPARGRAKIPVARGRNIFPAEEERGRGRGRVRVNNLYKRFKQQHRDSTGGASGEGGELYNDAYGEKRFEDGRSYSRSRSRSRGRKKHSSTSSSRSSSSSDSSSPKKKKKKKEKKHKKKKKGSAKKKKRDAESDSDSDHKEEGLDWRVELLKKMKDIKNLPPEQLETEFKKAMAEKKRKEEAQQHLFKQK